MVQFEVNQRGRVGVKTADAQRQFRRLIATGMTLAEAALEAGVSVPVGIRWLRRAGGMRPTSMADSSDRYMSFEGCEKIALLRA